MNLVDITSNSIFNVMCYVLSSRVQEFNVTNSSVSGSYRLSVTIQTDMLSKRIFGVSLLLAGRCQSVPRPIFTTAGLPQIAICTLSRWLTSNNTHSTVESVQIVVFVSDKQTQQETMSGLNTSVYTTTHSTVYCGFCARHTNTVGDHGDPSRIWFKQNKANCWKTHRLCLVSVTFIVYGVTA